MTQFGFVAPGFSPAQPSKCRPEGRRYGKLSHYPDISELDMMPVEANLAEPRHEAAFFYGLFLRGHPLQKLRADIDVPPQVLERWQRLAVQDPWYQAAVERIVNYRKEVLAIFDSLVFREMITPTRMQ